MSGLVGAWHRDGRPIDTPSFAAAVDALAHRGRDHRGVWCDGSIALACQVGRATPESAEEVQPVSSPDGTTLIFDGRLDNRDEILARLPRLERNIPDATLALAAWGEWGDRAFAQLDGDFAIAIFDPHTHSLSLARDPVGCRPLYYWIRGHALVFGSEVKSIRAYEGVRLTSNVELIVDALVSNRRAFDDDGATFFREVRAVLPGCCVKITRSRETIARYWDFDPEVRLRYRSYSDYVEHFRTLFTRAVQVRLRSAHPVAVAVSGGLDSSVVLCLAADQRRGGQVRSALVPLTCTPEDEPVEENQAIAAIERQHALRIARIRAGPAADPARLRQFGWHAETPELDDGWCALGPLMACAAGRGARVVLTGLWSDQILFTTAYLTDVFRRLAWGRIVRHLDTYTRYFPDANPRYFRARFVRDLAVDLVPQSLRAGLRRARGRRPQPRYATAHARSLYQAIRCRAHRLQFESDEKMAASYGLEHATPFLDRRLIALLMAIPGDVQNHDGVPRALLRDAMRGTAPDVVLARRWADESERLHSRMDAYRSLPIRVAPALGWRVNGHDAYRLAGLDVWNDLFFSDTLAPPDRGGGTRDG